MPTHLWGSDFDWEALDDAGAYIEKNCRRWGRVGVHTKEKYGTLRVSTTAAFFCFEPFQCLIYPGYYGAQFPPWFRTYIDVPLGTLLETLRISKLIRKWQYVVLKHFWKRAAKKWPHIATEILDEYDD